MRDELKNIIAAHADIALEDINTVIEYEKMINSIVFGSIEASFMAGIPLWCYKPDQYDPL